MACCGHVFHDWCISLLAAAAGHSPGLKVQAGIGDVGQPQHGAVGAQGVVQAIHVEHLQ